jgi:magnesium transporter
MTIFVHQESGKKGLESFTLGPRMKLDTGKFAWIDIANPTAEEEKRLEKQLGIEIPTLDEVSKNTLIRRFGQVGKAVYLSAAVLTRANRPYPTTTPVKFILLPNMLVTVRYADPTSFKHFRQRLQVSPELLRTPFCIIKGLLEEMVQRIADNVEAILDELDEISHQVFSEQQDADVITTSELKTLMQNLGRNIDLNTRLFDSLHSMQRMIANIQQVESGRYVDDAQLRSLMSQTVALSEQSGFIFNTAGFLLDAILGLINVQQNRIIKVFSIASVIFLPPTLVASIYGMNFHHMPELAFKFGYPMAALMMAVSAVLPFLYFRYKKWL